MKRKRYEAYKESGIEWIGEIPAHWEIEKGKWLFKQLKRSVKPEDEVVTCFRDGQVTLRKNRRTEGFTNALKEHGYQGVRKGDLVIHNMDAFAGAIGVSDSDGKATPVYTICLPLDNHKVNTKFYALYLRNLALQDFILSLAKGIRERSTDFRFNDFKDLLFPVPPKNEQDKIVNYLDRKTAQIDKAITLKERLIERLKEQRQILINRAVTQGLDPDVPMKESGVEWIGEIPAHWEIKKLKHLVKTHSGNGFPIEEQNNNLGTIPFFKVSDIDGDSDYISKANNYVQPILVKKKKWNLIPPNSIVTAKIGEALRKNKRKITKVECIIDNNCIAIEAISIDNKFNYYLHHLIDFDLFSNPGAVPSISVFKYKNFYVALPPKQEQIQIAEYLDKKTAQIDKVIDLQQKQIDKLKAYKASLIDAVVTGKVKIVD